MRLLQEESELDEIVQLVGMDALSAPDRLKLEAARSIPEDFLHQNAFHEIDTFTSLKKQHMMMMLMMAYYDKAGEALAQGVNIERLVSLPAVSYTHLDVYKRQSMTVRISRCFQALPWMTGSSQPGPPN